MENAGCVEKKESPIDKAKQSLGNNLELTRELASKFEDVLASVLTQPEKPEVSPESTTSAQCSLEAYLREMDEIVVRLKKYIGEIQNRIQL